MWYDKYIIFYDDLVQAALSNLSKESFAAHLPPFEQYLDAIGLRILRPEPAKRGTRGEGTDHREGLNLKSLANVT